MSVLTDLDTSSHEHTTAWARESGLLPSSVHPARQARIELWLQNFVVGGLGWADPHREVSRVFQAMRQPRNGLKPATIPQLYSSNASRKRYGVPAIDSDNMSPLSKRQLRDFLIALWPYMLLAYSFEADPADPDFDPTETPPAAIQRYYDAVKDALENPQDKTKPQPKRQRQPAMPENNRMETGPGRDAEALVQWKKDKEAAEDALLRVINWLKTSDMPRAYVAVRRAKARLAELNSQAPDVDEISAVLIPLSRRIRVLDWANEITRSINRVVFDFTPALGRSRARTLQAIGLKWDARLRAVAEQLKVEKRLDTELGDVSTFVDLDIIEEIDERENTGLSRDEKRLAEIVLEIGNGGIGHILRDEANARRRGPNPSRRLSTADELETDLQRLYDLAIEADGVLTRLGVAI